MFRKCVVKCEMFIYNKMRLSVTISLHPRRQVATVSRCPASASIMWVLSSHLAGVTGSLHKELYNL